MKLWLKAGLTIGLISMNMNSSIECADPQAVGPIGFGGGLNLYTIPTDISDDESVDMCNCVPLLNGSAGKKGGSKRYIEQAISSQPFTSLYRAYFSSGTNINRVLIGVNGNKIVYSTDGVNPMWLNGISTITSGQTFRFVTMNNKVIAAGDKLTDNIKMFDLPRTTFTDMLDTSISTSGFINSTDTIIVNGKYPLVLNNYFMIGNVKISTFLKPLTEQATYYNNRLYYSLLNEFSSMTANRYLVFDSEIAGLESMFGRAHVLHDNSIDELNFTVLNLLANGGDQSITEIVRGFGAYAPNMTANTGQFYVLGSLDGIRLWDGGRRSRLTVSEESRIISTKIKPLIDKLIKYGTYRKAVGKYYPKREWYILAYEDPDKFPRNANNSAIVYDFKTGNWFPVCNWFASSWETFDGSGDFGQLVYGDSYDGFVHFADVESESDDSSKQISIDVMDSTVNWAGSNQDTLNYKEGSASLRLWADSVNTISTMVRTGVFPLGEWYDKTKITKNDYLQFKVYPTSQGNIASLRVDLEVNDVDGAFDNNFSSITISSGALISGSTKWTEINIKLSSFPILNIWTGLNSEEIPFANTLTFYGIRFVLTGVNITSASIDDLRVVQATKNPNKIYRFSKLFNFGSPAFKTFGQLQLVSDRSSDASIRFDLYNDFGIKVRSGEFKADLPKEVIVIGFTDSTGSIDVLDSIDFSVKRSTDLGNIRIFNGIANKDNIFVHDRTNDREIKLNRDNFSITQTTFGSFGSGTTNFNTVVQHGLDDENLWLADISNQKIKKHSLSDLSFRGQYGTLGSGTTSLHQPHGISVSGDGIKVANEGNYNLLFLNKSTFGFISKTDVDYNTSGESSLAEDEQYLYLGYNKLSNEFVYFQDVILEKRDRNNGELINRIKILPKNIVENSTYTLNGDIALMGRYIYIVFANNEVPSATTRYYLQKRLKNNFELVNEYISPKEFYTVMGDAKAYIPQLKNEPADLLTRGEYFQIKYYDDGLDNNFTLYNQTFLIEPESVKYK
mgnify:CR=1 FL=1